MRLIDADNAISVLEILADKCDSRVVWEQAIAVLKDVPTIAAEPVKHYDTESYKTTATELPPVEYAPVKHGRWEETAYCDYDDTYRCSVCGVEWEFITGTPQENGANYCPNCGAMMDLTE